MTCSSSSHLRFFQAHDQKLAQEKELRENDLAYLTDKNRADVEKLQALKGMGVDLTQFLVAVEKAPDRHIRIDTGRGDAGQEKAGPVQFHMHEQGVESPNIAWQK